jgi:hypothetical protein
MFYNHVIIYIIFLIILAAGAGANGQADDKKDAVEEDNVSKAVDKSNKII